MQGGGEHSAGLQGGVQLSQTENKWVFNPDREDIRECLSSKEAALGLLSVMEKQEVVGHLLEVLIWKTCLRILYLHWMQLQSLDQRR